jgi:hypothetical protein
MIDQNYFLSTNIIGDFNDSTIDNSGYGSLPAAEKNQTYFAYFSSIGGTGPEIIDQTAYFVKYLIDAQGNVVSPQPNSIDILNMLQNFEAGRVVNVTSLEGTTLFTTLLGTKQTTGVGRIQPILITETGVERTDYITTMSFSAGPGGVGLDSAYNYAFLATKATSAFISNTSFATLDFGQEANDANGNYNNSTYIYTFPNDTISQGTQVSFRTTLRITSAFSGPNQSGRSNYIKIQIQRSVDGGFNYSPLELTDGVYTRLNLYNDGDTEDVSAQTKPLNFNTGDKIRVQYSVDSSGVENQLKILAASDGNSTLFTNIQTYTANNLIYSPFWSIGTYTTSSNDFTVITASLGLTGLNQNQYLQVTPTASAAFGFSNITLPSTPQPGDFIRFEYDPSNIHIIYENMTTTDGNLALKVVPPVPSGSILDHFCIYRINPNAGNQIILNVPKPSGTTGQPLTGFIKPQYMSKELEDNFTTIVQKLAAEGLLT